FGHPFIWCMLHSFGSTLRMHGSVHTINKGIGDASATLNTSMIGVGITILFLYTNFANYRANICQFEFNDKNQITLWGPKGQIVDYATKHWSGIVKGFFKPLRATIPKSIAYMLKNSKKPFNNAAFNNIVLAEFEKPFNYQMKRYTTQPRGNSYNVLKFILSIWSKLS
ncbi:N-acetyl-alpha-glucosaminidase, partial [Cochliomyia hominivorax]